MKVYVIVFRSYFAAKVQLVYRRSRVLPAEDHMASGPAPQFEIRPPTFEAFLSLPVRSACPIVPLDSVRISWLSLSADKHVFVWIDHDT